MHTHEIAACYKFQRIADPVDLRDRLHAICEKAGAKGILLVAKEGRAGRHRKLG